MNFPECWERESPRKDTCTSYMSEDDYCPATGDSKELCEMFFKWVREMPPVKREEVKGEPLPDFKKF